MKKKTFKTRVTYSFLIMLFTSIMLLPSFNAAYAIFLSTSRINIEKNQNYAELLILNRSEKKKLITFSWSDMIVNPNGGFRTLKDGETYPNYKPAQSFIRYSPRRAILNAGESQRVRMYVKRTADMAEGEYHSHFTIIAEPVRAQQGMKDLKGKLQGQISVNAGTNIPVFVRHGDTNVDVAIQEAYIIKRNNIDYLVIRSLNNSTRSTYGVVKMLCVMPAGERVERDITTMRLYTEVQELNWSIGINDFPVRECQDLSLTITDPDDFELKGKIYARATVERR